jgi:ABC-2 type transport system permease protein
VLGSTVAVFALEAVTLLILANLLFDVPIPSTIPSLAVALLLGALVFAALGMALTTAIRSAEGSSAVVNAIYLPAAFLSGAFWTPHAYPRFLEVIAEVLPLTYFIRLMRDIVVHEDQIWSHPGTVLYILAWGAAGVIVCLRSFRWQPHEG